MIITRFHNIEALNCIIEFLTPTFLGGADQQAELRPAPFKNLLRQWWRVANGNLSPTKLAQTEGELFGTVLGEDQAHASRVRVVVKPEDGFATSTDAFSFGQTFHPEVRNRGNNGRNIDNALYLGYGPVTYAQGRTHCRRYIQPGSKANLSFLVPKEYWSIMDETLCLVDAFGAIGSRSRNGYGSIALTGNTFVRKSPSLFTKIDVGQIHQGNKMYPHALGSANNQLLCWETDTFSDWNKVMQILAEGYLKVRTSLNVASRGIQERHILGYPVTNHPDSSWGGNNGRMPSQLRLMVKRNDQNKLVGRILHLPHKLPKTWNIQLGSEFSVWQTVHRFLDHYTNAQGNKILRRVP